VQVLGRALWPAMSSSSSVVCCMGEVWQWSEGGKYVVLVCPVVETSNGSDPGSLGSSSSK
jgi:hypothetical protein